MNSGWFTREHQGSEPRTGPVCLGTSFSLSGVDAVRLVTGNCIGVHPAFKLDIRHAASDQSAEQLHEY